MTTMLIQVIENSSTDMEECINTPTGLDSYGYGQVREGKRMRKAHQVAYERHKGEIPIGQLVRHICDKRSCINPKHLILGTVQDNSDDMVNRKRSAVERNVHAKLTWDDVRAIRISTLTVEQLSKQYNVQTKQIRRILRNEQWLDN